jgi:hypothetical protein
MGKLLPHHLHKVRLAATTPLVLLALSFVFFVVVCPSQDSIRRTDFSGRWISDSVKMSSNSGRQLPQSLSNVKVELVVKQAGNELRVKEISSGDRGDFSRESVYYLDGRGESNDGRSQDLIYDSKTELKDRKLSINSTIRPRNSTGSINHAEEWELSSDGKSLRITTKSGKNEIRYEKLFRLAP